MLIQDAKIANPKTGIVLLGGHAARALGVVRGVVVLSVQPGSSAAVASIRAASTLPATAALKNDIILSCQGQPLGTDVDFQKEVQGETLKGGNTIIISVSRAIGAGGERKVYSSTSPSSEVSEVNKNNRLQKLDDVLIDLTEQLPTPFCSLVCALTTRQTGSLLNSKQRACSESSVWPRLACTHYTGAAAVSGQMCGSLILRRFGP